MEQLIEGEKKVQTKDVYKKEGQATLYSYNMSHKQQRSNVKSRTGYVTTSKTKTISGYLANM